MLITVLEEGFEVDPEVDAKEEKFELIREVKNETSEVLRDLRDDAESIKHDINVLENRAK